MRRFAFLLSVSAALWLSGCASVPREPVRSGAAVPLLRLAPDSLGRELFLQQRLSVHAGGKVKSLDVMLEVDAASVRLALLGFGQTAARLEWDGAEMRASHADWWPAEVRGERILNDLQLVLWPADAVRSGLPQRWTLDATADKRVLRQAGEAVVRVVYVSPSHAELAHERDRYRIVIESAQTAEGAS